MKKIAYQLLSVVAIAAAALSCNNATDAEKAYADSVQMANTRDSLALITEDSLKAVTASKGVAVPNPAKARGKGVIMYEIELEKKLLEDYEQRAMELDAAGIYYRTEIRPSFPGGQKALANFIRDNITYPQNAIDNGVEGDVAILFAVDEAGKVYTPKIIGDRTGYGLDEAALEVVSKMPNWNPGRIQGKNVKSYYTLPISFNIQ